MKNEKCVEDMKNVFPMLISKKNFFIPINLLIFTHSACAITICRCTLSIIIKKPEWAMEFLRHRIGITDLELLLEAIFGLGILINLFSYSFILYIIS